MEEISKEDRKNLVARLSRANELLDSLSAKTQEDAALKSSLVKELRRPDFTPEKQSWHGIKLYAIAFVVAVLCSASILAPLVTAIQVTVGQFVILLMAPLYGLTPASDPTPEFTQAAQSSAIVSALLVWIAIWIAEVLLIKFIYNMFVKQTNKEIAANNAYLETEFANERNEVQANNAKTIARIEALSEEINSISQAWKAEVEDWYPVSYATPDACCFMREAVLNYRADSIKEAVNLYETHMHQLRMETQQQEQTRQAQLTAQLQMTMNERIEQNNQLMKQNLVLSEVAATAAVATANNTNVIAKNSKVIANNSAVIAANSARTAASNERIARDVSKVAQKVRGLRN